MQSAEDLATEEEDEDEDEDADVQEDGYDDVEANGERDQAMEAIDEQAEDS